MWGLWVQPALLGPVCSLTSRTLRTLCVTAGHQRVTARAAEGHDHPRPFLCGGATGAHVTESVGSYDSTCNRLAQDPTQGLHPAKPAAPMP